MGAEGQGCPEGVGGQGLPRRGEGFPSTPWRPPLLPGFSAATGTCRDLSAVRDRCAPQTQRCAVRQSGLVPTGGPSLPGTVVSLGPLRLS